VTFVKCFYYSCLLLFMLHCLAYINVQFKIIVLFYGPCVSLRSLYWCKVLVFSSRSLYWFKVDVFGLRSLYALLLDYV
jgi:hypothetical protein